MIERSYHLYRAAIAQIDYFRFREIFQHPDNFHTWFLITEIHVWMLIVRAMANPAHRNIIKTALVQEMWNEAVQRAMYERGTKSLVCSVIIHNQYLKNLSGHFQYAILAYDEGLMTNDMRLASALWELFFERNCDDFVKIELLVKYIRMNVRFIV